MKINTSSSLTFRIALSILCLSFFNTRAKIEAQELQRYEYESRHMGTFFRITLYAQSDSIAEAASDSAFSYIEFLNDIMSDYKENSELNLLAQKSGKGNFVPVSTPLFEVLSKAQQVAKETGGAFDVTVGPYVKLWRNIRKMESPALPSPEEIRKLETRVGYNYVRIDSTSQSVALDKPDMQLDLGGIAKGYAADEALRILGGFGIHRALVNAGGDVVTGEAPPDKDGWRVSIPLRHPGQTQMEFMTFVISNSALATSGDLFQYVEIDSKRYSHIVNPQTGIGLADRSTVSVVAPDGITADSYASAVSVLGPDAGIRFIENKPDVAARIQYFENDTVAVRKSSSFGNLEIAR